MFLMLMQFIAFPDKSDALLINNPSSIVAEASGSLGLYYQRKCHQTFPNETYHFDKEFDWCSNIGSAADGKKPWIQYRLKNKKMKLNSFALRNGCCYHPCCCLDDNTVYDYDCCCLMHSFSLQGSNDNRTWKTLFKGEKVKDFWSCQFKTFDVESGGEYFTFIRLTMDEPYPGCIFCMQINQIELYGETKESPFDYENEDIDENDESVSIIGKISRNHVE